MEASKKQIEFINNLKKEFEKKTNTKLNKVPEKMSYTIADKIIKELIKKTDKLKSNSPEQKEDNKKAEN
jgi:hypothetical protein